MRRSGLEKSWKNILKKHWIFLIFGTLLITLLFKNPFSGQNSISNLDPYPDALLYITASKNLAKEGDLKIIYKNVLIDSTIPPLYPITLSPIYFIFGDHRAFYFVNILLTLTSTVFFYKIIVKLFEDKLIKIILFFTFVSNFIIFWYPSVAMAENLLICLFIISIHLLIGPLTNNKSVLLGLLTTAFFATKYVAFTLSFSLLLTFIILLFCHKRKRAQKLKLFSLYLLALTISFVILLFIESETKQRDLLTQLQSYLPNIVQALSSFGSSGLNNPIEAKSTYSGSYVQNNLLRYFAGLIGGPAPAAGKDLIIIPIIIGMGSLAGIFVNVFLSRLKLLSFYFLTIFLTTTFYILFFFVTDIRYIFVMIPIQIIVFGISITSILRFLNNKKLFFSSNIIILVTLTAVILNVYSGVLNQLKVNFFGDDRSKVYETVMSFNRNFDQQKPGQKPFIISTLPPLAVDSYSNQNYNLLPFSRFQHFIYKPEIWGIPENSDLFELYKQYLKEGREIYLSDHDTNDSSFYSFAYIFYKEKFILTPVSKGCHNQCNIFRLGLKDHPGR